MKRVATSKERTNVVEVVADTSNSFKGQNETKYNKRRQQGFVGGVNACPD